MSDPKASPVRGSRRALSHVGGRVEVSADDPDLGECLEDALRVSAEDPAARAHVHGFHSYAARLHPVTAARLVEGLSRPRATVLDPFMGSGTVLVEARLLGRLAIGTDVNPLSIGLAHLKTRGTSARERDALVEAAHRVASSADERRLEKAGPTRRYGKEDRELFDVHILLELDGLRAAIEVERPGFVREALKLVLSAILVKASRKPGDTVQRVGPRRLASGFAIRLFAKKTEELAERLEEFTDLLPRDAPECRLEEDDARELRTVPARSVDLVVTSPPYPGVYDYAKHHAVRLRWLDLDMRGFEQREIGARRTVGSLSREEAVMEWRRDLGRTLETFARVLRPSGLAALVLADSALYGAPLYADDEMEEMAARAGLPVLAVASQRRPNFFGGSRDAFLRRPRREHVFVLEAPAATEPPRRRR